MGNNTVPPADTSKGRKNYIALYVRKADEEKVLEDLTGFFIYRLSFQERRDTGHPQFLIAVYGCRAECNGK